jgi:hypothetical protein
LAAALGGALLRVAGPAAEPTERASEPGVEMKAHQAAEAEAA